MYDKLMKNFEERLAIYTNNLKEKAENKSYTEEHLKILFDYVKEEWRTFDKLITEMLSYDLLTNDEYGKIYEDGYKKYKEYFNICTETIVNR